MEHLFQTQLELDVGRRGGGRRLCGEGWRRVACPAQPAPRRLLLAGLWPLDLKECLEGKQASGWCQG